MTSSKTPMTREEIVEVLSHIRPNHTFLAVMNYTNEEGEVSNFSISFHIPYHLVVQRSLERIKLYTPANAIEDMAKREMVLSYNTSLRKLNNHDFGDIEKVYQYFWYIEDGKRNLVKGVRMHHDSGEIHINGYLVHKKILIPTIYRKVDSSAKTLAKHRIEKLLPISKYRQFKLAPDRFGRVSVEKLTIFPPID